MLALAVFVGATLSVALAGIASAGPGVPPAVLDLYYTDPQNTNVPYLAWDGEQIRLVKCFTAAEVPTAGVGRFVIEDWSGANFQKPVFENSGLGATDGTATEFAGAGDQAGNFCFATTVVSVKPGLAVIKLVVEPTATPNQGAPVAKHQFLAVWMDINSLSAVELNGAPNPAATTGITVGDFGAGGTATNIFNTPFANGLVDVRVTGSFPLGNNFSGMAPNDTVTLPNDWTWLAQHFSVEQGAFTQIPGAVSHRWDIHDSLSWDPAQALDGPAAHSIQSGCPGLNQTYVVVPGALSPSRFDTVDNCLGGGETTTFSNIFGQPGAPGNAGTIPPTIGPFDPVRPNATLLSDGLVNAGDAPMPAARITVQLGGSAGALVAADKHVLYSRNGTGVASAAFPNNAHNLYAPFYAAYIPATAAPATSSGIAGPSGGNDFAGFLNTNPYHFWDPIVLSSRGGVNACLGALGETLATPTGADRIAVYTDEHGEAIFGYNPNAGFLLAANSNNQCAAVAGPATFSSTINVQAEYPYQQPFNAPRPAADTITKTVNTAATKTLACVPKTQNAMFCVETIRNLQGQLVANAPVAFSRTPLGNIEPDAAAQGGFDTRGQIVVSNPNSVSEPVVIRTNALGQAGVLVTESLRPPNPNSCVDVKAENLGTAFPTAQAGVFNPPIAVFQEITPATGAVGCAGISGPVAAPVTSTSTGTANSNTNTAVSNTTQTSTSVAAPVSTAVAATTGVEANTTIVTLNGNTTPAKKTAAARGTLAYVRVAFAQQTGRQLVVRVNGKVKTAKLAIVLKAKNGAVLQKVVRYVPTNKDSKVKNLRLSTKVKSVSVSVL